MIALDTQEKCDLIINALEDGEIVLDNRVRTEEEWAEISRELAELKAAMRQKKLAAETVLA
jgi:pyruvate/2-oxoglutarate dehydrogenase complex dihydrolipoamide acyltransferase (E2) component